MATQSKLEILRRRIAERKDLNLGWTRKEEKKDKILTYPPNVSQFISFYLSPDVPTVDLEKLNSYLESLLPLVKDDGQNYEPHELGVYTGGIKKGYRRTDEDLARRTRTITAVYSNILDEEAKQFLQLNISLPTEQVTIEEYLIRRLFVHVLPHPLLVTLVKNRYAGILSEKEQHEFKRKVGFEDLDPFDLAIGGSIERQYWEKIQELVKPKKKRFPF